MLEYISQFSQPIFKTIQSAFLSLAFLAGATPTTIINNPVQEVDLAPIHQEINSLGANISALADFRSSLTSEITSTATTMTLESFTSGSDSLTVGRTYGFKIGGREYVIGEASTGNTIINMTRGISRGTGTTTVAAYQSRWGRGSSVEITDAPILIRTANILGGVQTMENVIKYDSTVATSTIAADNRNLVNYELLVYTAFNGAGVINASLTQKGVVELATQTETASSTANGSAGVLAIPATNATSTYNAATAPLRVVVTQNNGKIDNNFIATSTLASIIIPVGSITAYASTTAPDGWLLMNGQAVPRSTYSALYAILGTSYGVGDGSTTFNVPNATGRALVMASTTQTATSSTDGTANTRSTLGYKGGETMHTQTSNELASHSHTVTGTPNAANSSGASTNSIGDAGTYSSGATGNSVPMNVLDPYIIINYIIKY